MGRRVRTTRNAGWASVGLAIVLSFAAVHVATSATAAAPSVSGSWTAPANIPLVAIHSTVVHGGDVFMFERPQGHPGSAAILLDPVSGTFTDVTIPRARDAFCAGHSVLADGRVFVTGGHPITGGQGLGVPETDLFQPSDGSWTPGPTMAEVRWYPSNIQLGDGSTLIFSGQADPNHRSITVEHYDPAANTLTTLPFTANRLLPLYPRMHLLPNGRILVAGPNRPALTFDPANATWKGGPKMNALGRTAGTSVLLPGLQRVMAIGGSNSSGTLNSAEILDLSAPTPAWSYTAPMHHARKHANAVLLPDGEVLVVGGGVTGNYSDPVRIPELYDPASNAWTDMAAQTAQRMYHSTAVLLPDGRVLSAGSDSGTLKRTYEIFSPPYLFRGARPVIDAAPSSLTYGQAFDVSTGDAGTLSKVVLMRPGSATHSIDIEQRDVELAFTSAGSSVSVTAPSTSNQAPPGWYMVFLVNTEGVPSIAAWVHLA
jgi:hypothetical protein